jgi:hypothetical protein
VPHDWVKEFKKKEKSLSTRFDATIDLQYQVPKTRDQTDEFSRWHKAYVKGNDAASSSKVAEIRII